jgi:hypothetical protein
MLLTLFVMNADVVTYSESSVTVLCHTFGLEETSLLMALIDAITQ